MDTQRLEDFLLADGLPVPLNHLQQSIDTTELFSIGARKCAGFFRAMEEHFKVDELWGKFFEASIPGPWFEYILFSILDTDYPHLHIAEQVLRLKCLRRAIMRKESEATLDPFERELLDNLRKYTGIASVPQLLSWAYSARRFVVSIVAGKPCKEHQRDAIVFLIRSEVAALKQRITKISDSIDVYNMKAMARVLPSIRTFDENARDAERLATAIEQNLALQERSLTFIEALNCESFDQWIKPATKRPELRLLVDTFTIQREKLVPTRSLVALSSLFRWVDESRGGTSSHPLHWIHNALSAYTRNKFSVDVGPAIAGIKDMVTNGGAWVDGTTISGNFSDRLYSQWIGHTMLTRPLEVTEEHEQEEHVSYKQLIAAHIHNDTLLDRLLDVSKVYQTPGLVQYIAERTRSVNILSKIATRNYLHSGSGNGGVPKALVKNPAPLPMDLIRQFLKRSFFNPIELRSILMDGTIRPDVAKEIRAILPRL